MSVFKILSKANLKINIKKSNFCAEKVNFLGQTLYYNFVRPQSDKIQCIVDFPLPESKKKLQSFLGLYRNYVVDYAYLSNRLYDLVKKKSPRKLTWTKDLVNCFENLKLALSQDIKLSHVDSSLPFFLLTDASSYAIRAILGQRQSPECPFLHIQCISKN